MKSFVKAVLHFIIVGLLTLFTQVGGAIWLLCLPLFYFIKRSMKPGWQQRLVKIAAFTAVYLLLIIFLIPPLAKWQCNRVPLPVWSNPSLRPHSVFYYCLMNHHYVRPEMRNAAEKVAKGLSAKFPGTVVCYLDGNFPFIDGYPLEPHFSHRDGKKLDVALHWAEAKTGRKIFGTPSFYGYGACAVPKPGEQDMEEECRKQGNWYRSLIMKWAEKFYSKEKYQFDEEVTREMVRLFAEQPSVSKILLEPHLKQRLQLGKYDKIRFQGCKAARHDDHIHVQIR